MTNKPIPSGRSPGRRWLSAAAGLALVAVAATGFSQLGGDDLQRVEQVANRPAGPAEADDPGEVSDVFARQVIWPRLSSDVRFDHPVNAVRSFVRYYAQFDDPTIGEFQAADNHSGEVVVRARPDGPETRVQVAVWGNDQGHDEWFVTGAATGDITVQEPRPGTTLDCPMATSGTALAFEGTVQVRIDAYQPDGRRVEVGRDVVTGSGGPPAGPFTGDIPCTVPTGVERAGVVFYWTEDASGRLDGPEQVVAVPIDLPQDDEAPDASQDGDAPEAPQGGEAPSAPAVTGEPSFTG